MKFTVITLFPQLIESFVSEGLLGQAAAKGLVTVETVNPRKYTEDAHHTVDDRAFGGGDGMVMKVEPLARAVADLKPARVVVLSPQGRVWNQTQAEKWANDSDRHFVLVCGRYAGIDHRFTVQYADDEISVGDFVLNGGEVAACAVIESVARLLPGALGNRISAVKDSFSEGGMLECPQFTRPREVERLSVPTPLLSGNHKQIEAFEKAVATVRTLLLRPDLLTSPPKDLKKMFALLAALADGELFSLGIARADLEKLQQEYL
jgi:tRNA (guanine37-N1)-methyltransferase